MRARLLAFCLPVLVIVLASTHGLCQDRPGRPRPVRIKEGALPILFEPAGAGGAPAGMVGRAGGLSLGLEADGITVALPGPAGPRLRMTFEGGRRTVMPRGVDLQKSETNYLLGSDAGRWRTHVPNYARVKYEGLYPGVDAIFYGNGGEMEHDFLVAPGADPGQIRMHFAGARVVAAKDGSITVGGGDGRLVLRAPVIYQQEGGRRRERHGAFRVLPNGDVGFKVGSYDRHLRG